ncbi:MULTISPECIES: cytochrome bd oxidase small subunit CydS [Anaerobacillus]
MDFFIIMVAPVLVVFISVIVFFIWALKSKENYK